MTGSDLDLLDMFAAYVVSDPTDPLDLLHQTDDIDRISRQVARSPRQTVNKTFNSVSGSQWTVAATRYVYSAIMAPLTANSSPVLYMMLVDTHAYTCVLDAGQDC